VFCAGGRAEFKTKMTREWYGGEKGISQPSIVLTQMNEFFSLNVKWLILHHL